MQIDDKTYKLPGDQYFEEVSSKRRICLHFTAGSTAVGAHSTFMSTEYNEGTAYLIGDKGQIYEMFDPRYWALHLYRHKRSDPHDKLKYKLERETIGIEIVNPGPLFLGKKEKNRNNLYPWWGKDKEIEGSKWCTLDETDKYLQYEHRSHYYWATFSKGQYSSLLWLTGSIGEWFNIDIFTDPVADSLDYWGVKTIDSFTGLCNHGNFRRDKLDIGPAFDWSRIGYHGYQHKNRSIV